MTAPETFTAASKQPLTTGRRPDMTAICAFRPKTKGDVKRPSGALAPTIHEAVRQPGRTRDARSSLSRDTTLCRDRGARAGRSTRRRLVAPNHSAAAIRARIWPDCCPSSSSGSCWECSRIQPPRLFQICGDRSVVDGLVHADVVKLVSGQWIVKRGENGGYEILDVDEIPLERIAASVAEQGYRSLRLATLGDFWSNERVPDRTAKHVVTER
jgi:hypothetical protein